MKGILITVGTDDGHEMAVAIAGVFRVSPAPNKKMDALERKFAKTLRDAVVAIVEASCGEKARKLFDGSDAAKSTESKP